MKNWNLPSCSVRQVQVISKKFAEIQERRQNFFPNLRNDDELIIACDYSGEHVEANFNIYTFLLTNRKALDAWEEKRLEVRRKYLSDGRRLAFKRLSDIQRQMALVPFITSTEEINGIIMNVAIDKSLATSNLGYDIPHEIPVKPKVFGKLSKIAFLGSVLIAGLSAPNQKLRWITDDDETVSNDLVSSFTHEAIGKLLYNFCPHSLGEIAIGVASKFDDERRAEDLCAIPDLIGGAVSDSFDSLNGALPRSTNIFTPFSKQLPTKSEIILAWLSVTDSALKKVQFMIRPAENNQLLFSFGNVEFNFKNPHPTRIWTPPDKGWKKAADTWNLP